MKYIEKQEIGLDRIKQLLALMLALVLALVLNVYNNGAIFQSKAGQGD